LEAWTVSIRVEVAEAAPEGALAPRYDEESQILAAESPVAAEWPFGVDIDGRVVFDLGFDRPLMNFDLHIGKKMWKVDPGVRWPAEARGGRLVFDHEAINVKSFRLPLRVTTDGFGLVAISIGDERNPEPVPVALSDECIRVCSE
jgi:hypothetical protein